jgi:hypothetical protein
LWQLAILTVFAVALAFATGLLRVREMKDIRM